MILGVLVMNIFCDTIDTFAVAIKVKLQELPNLVVFAVDGNGFDSRIKTIPAYVLFTSFGDVNLCFTKYYNGYWQVGAERSLQQLKSIYTELGVVNYSFIRTYVLENNEDEILRGYLNNLDKEGVSK